LAAATQLPSEECKVNVSYLGAISGMVKRRRETVVLPKETASVQMLLEVLSKEYGERFEKLTKYAEHSSPLVTIFVNGIVVSDVSDSRKILPDQSEVEVSLINQMSGG
jgi:molybdopterin converting factor small subunit